ncbi:MAG TPA: carboxypeptidase-like regulatory domain-containing protein, partial [Bryobacterales bacterium]|nr:carboxypeptidase-like regulatory domain-containing protein [Bryobacterales bacterium]
MHRSSTQIAVLAVLVIVFTTFVFAQIITSSIVGRITDSSGGVVPGAQITVTNTGTGLSSEAAADASGAYSVPNLQFGVYEVTVKKAGFQTYRATGIQVLASQSVRVDVSLQVGAVQQTVDVVAEA